LVGLRGLRDLESINLISDDLHLMKFRASDLSGIQDYWTVIDKYGQIRQLPRKSEQHLIWSNFSSGQSRQKRSGCSLVLKGGQKRILSLESDLAYEEHEVTAIEFNRIGEVSQIKSFSKDCYDDELRMHIENELLLNKDLLDLDMNKKRMDLESAKKTVKSLKYADDILVSP